MSLSLCSEMICLRHWFIFIQRAWHPVGPWDLKTAAAATAATMKTMRSTFISGRLWFLWFSSIQCLLFFLLAVLELCIVILVSWGKLSSEVPLRIFSLSGMKIIFLNVISPLLFPVFKFLKDSVARTRLFLSPFSSSGWTSLVFCLCSPCGWSRLPLSFVFAHGWFPWG